MPSQALRPGRPWGVWRRKQGRSDVGAEGISAFARSPNSARLWMEYLYSPAGQNALMRGYCSPVELPALTSAGIVDEEAVARLPSTTGGRTPTLDQIAKARSVIGQQWASTVFPID